jgi:hypothetical protein
MQTQPLIHGKLFITAILTNLSGYLAMALIPSKIIQQTYAPVAILAGFVLLVFSIIISPKKSDVKKD